MLNESSSELAPDPTVYRIPETVDDVDRLGLDSPHLHSVAMRGLSLRLQLQLNDALDTFNHSEMQGDATASERDHFAVLSAQQTGFINKLTQKSERDSKTGLLHAEAFREKVTDALSHNLRRSPADAHNYLMFVDLDDFKAWNTLYTESINDHMTLLPVANIIASQTREGSDCAARWGGEEFTIFLRDITSDDLRTYAERLKQSINDIETPESPRGIEHLGVSIGVAQIDTAEDYQAALERANLGKKFAKNCVPGKNAVIYTDDLSDEQINYLKTLE